LRVLQQIAVGRDALAADAPRPCPKLVMSMNTALAENGPAIVNVLVETTAERDAPPDRFCCFVVKDPTGVMYEIFPGRQSRNPNRREPRHDIGRRNAEPRIDAKLKDPSVFR